MITYDDSDYFGLRILRQVHGSAVYRALVPAILSTLLLILGAWFWPDSHWRVDQNYDAEEEQCRGGSMSTNDTLLHPYVLTIYVNAFSLLLTFRLNFSYQRYWEAASQLFVVASRWSDAATCLAALHYQQHRQPQWKLKQPMMGEKDKTIQKKTRRRRPSRHDDPMAPTLAATATTATAASQPPTVTKGNGGPPTRDDNDGRHDLSHHGDDDGRPLVSWKNKWLSKKKRKKQQRWAVTSTGDDDSEYKCSREGEDDRQDEHQSQKDEEGTSKHNGTSGEESNNENNNDDDNAPQSVPPPRTTRTTTMAGRAKHESTLASVVEDTPALFYDGFESMHGGGGEGGGGGGGHSRRKGGRSGAPINNNNNNNNRPVASHQPPKRRKSLPINATTLASSPDRERRQRHQNKYFSSSKDGAYHSSDDLQNLVLLESSEDGDNHQDDDFGGGGRPPPLSMHRRVPSADVPQPYEQIRSFQTRPSLAFEQTHHVRMPYSGLHRGNGGGGIGDVRSAGGGGRGRRRTSFTTTTAVVESPLGRRRQQQQQQQQQRSRPPRRSASGPLPKGAAVSAAASATRGSHTTHIDASTIADLTHWSRTRTSNNNSAGDFHDRPLPNNGGNHGSSSGRTSPSSGIDEDELYINDVYASMTNKGMPGVNYDNNHGGGGGDDDDDVPAPSLFMQEAAHLFSLMSAVAMASLRADMEGVASPLVEYVPGLAFPPVNPDEMQNATVVIVEEEPSSPVAVVAVDDDNNDETGRLEDTTLVPGAISQPPTTTTTTTPEKPLQQRQKIEIQPHYLSNSGFWRALYFLLGLTRSPRQRTLYNATRPFSVLGGISDHEVDMLQQARGPEAQMALCGLWLKEFITREYLEGSTGVVGPPIVSRVYQFLSEGTAQYSQCRKIAYVQFPFPQAQLTIFFLFVSLIMFPYLFFSYVNSPLMACFLNFVTVVCFFGQQEVARELQDPFYQYPNDLPLNNYQAQFNEALISSLFTGVHPDFANFEEPDDDEGGDHSEDDDEHGHHSIGGHDWTDQDRGHNRKSELSSEERLLISIAAGLSTPYVEQREDDSIPGIA